MGWLTSRTLVQLFALSMKHEHAEMLNTIFDPWNRSKRAMMDAAAEQKAEQLHYAEKYGVLASMMAKDCWAADSDYRGIGSTYDAARSAATHAFKARPDLRD